MGRSLDKSKFEEWKTIFYRLEGWNTKTGWPKRSTLEKMDMKFVADALQAAGGWGRKRHEPSYDATGQETLETPRDSSV